MSERVLTLGWVASAVGGEVRAGSDESAIGEVTTDSRTLTAGNFFVALRGPRHDGHDHVEGAIAAGAGGVLVERRWAGAHRESIDGWREMTGCVVAGDTLEALQGMARSLRRASKAKVVAITGSAGKTTTKEAIASMLATRLRVVRNRGNLNNHIGLPLSLMELRREPDVAVMELGMNHQGEISRLVSIARPDVRVWTNVGDAHVGYFGSSDAIADAKAEILEDAGPHDALVCNADDARVMARVGAFPGDTITFGRAAHATVRAVDIEDRGLSGVRARLVTPVGERRLELSVLGLGNLANVLAATGVALRFGIPLDAIVEQAERARPAERRGAVKVAAGVTVIDDSYNSSPAALTRTLEMLSHERGACRKIAVLGEMLELGAQAEVLHRECGARAAGLGLGLLVTVGGSAARAMAEAAVQAGMPAETVEHVADSAVAADYLAGVVRPGDLVLVKGSRGVRTDIVVDRLTAAEGR